MDYHWETRRTRHCIFEEDCLSRSIIYMEHTTDGTAFAPCFKKVTQSQRFIGTKRGYCTATIKNRVDSDNQISKHALVPLADPFAIRPSHRLWSEG